jgi:hypothetical protein
VPAELLTDAEVRELADHAICVTMFADKFISALDELLRLRKENALLRLQLQEAQFR